MGSCPAPADRSDADLSTPPVAFSRDVLPIFEASCGISGANCHGDPSVTLQARPFLGYFNGATNAALVRMRLVGIPSQEDPRMNLVMPGDLSSSFLWRKVDNLQCTLASDCADSGFPDCGAAMPYGNPSLNGSSLDTIARWIAQGAGDN